jgi:hypothetical protein
MLKKLAFSVVFGLILLTVTFLIGEVALRIYNYFTHSHIFYDGSYNRYRGKPHAELYGFHLNSGGFSDTEFTAPPGDYRIIGLGDSFAFGIVPHDYTYLTKLEEKLKAHVGNVSLFNMGISQTNPSDYYTILTQEGADLKPDMVLLSFFVGNDFDVPRKPWYRYSYVLTALNYIAKVSWKVRDFTGHEPYCDSCNTFDRTEYLRIEKDRLNSWEYHIPENGQYPGGEKSNFAGSISALLRTRDYTKAQGARFMVVIIPDEMQVDKTLQQDLVKTYYANAGKLPYDVMTPTKMLIQELKKNNIEYIDLQTAFRDSIPSRQLYKPSDSHWNIAGNAFAADVLADSLVKILPAEKK